MRGEASETPEQCFQERYRRRRQNQRRTERGFLPEMSCSISQHDRSNMNLWNQRPCIILMTLCPPHNNHRSWARAHRGNGLKTFQIQITEEGNTEHTLVMMRTQVVVVGWVQIQIQKVEALTTFFFFPSC